MLVSSLSGPPPAVSIVLPTYNRATFLRQAFDSIRSQTFIDWELTIVDDGSSDNTRELIPELAAACPQQILYIHQSNQGAAQARNAALPHARGSFISFFDSDDKWLPHHLQDCVSALHRSPDVDWVYGACRIMDWDTGRTLVASHFYDDGRPLPFLKLQRRTIGDLQVIDDQSATACMIQHGLHCGLQHSVFRRRVFDSLRLPAYAVGEDQMFVILALKAGFRIGYIDRVHVEYFVHNNNLSAVGTAGSVQKRMQALTTLARAYEELEDRVALSVAERRALRRRLSNDYFWTIGYSLLWQNSRRQEALAMFRKALRLWPWDLRFWKTYLLARAKGLISPQPRA